MRLGVVTQWYDPEGSSAALPGVIARSLAAHGHEVHVITGFPNYPQGVLLDGYRQRPYLRETLRGVTVHRSPLYASHDQRAVRRAANYLSFATSATVNAVARVPRLDAVLVHGTPATSAIPALALKTLRGVPFVYQVQDLWPHTVVHSGFLSGSSSRVEGILHRYCDRVYSAADTVAVTSPGMARHIQDRGVPEHKIEFVPNWADEVAFRPVAPDASLAASLGLDRRFTVMYAGIFGGYQQLDILIAAARRLRDRADIGFALVGGGVAEAHLRVQAAHLDNVRFLPFQPFSRMASVLALGDVQLVSLADLPLFHATLPSKLQATLAAGRPIIGAVAGDAAQVIETSGAGILVQPGSVEAMTQAVVQLADAPSDELRRRGEKGREFYSAHYGERVAVPRLVGLLGRAADRRRRGR